jgi:hypothetical protein
MSTGDEAVNRARSRNERLKLTGKQDTGVRRESERNARINVVLIIGADCAELAHHL